MHIFGVEVLPGQGFVLLFHLKPCTGHVAGCAAAMGAGFVGKPNALFIQPGLNELERCSFGHLSQTLMLWVPPSQFCVSEHLALGCCFQHQSEMQFAAPSICYVRQIKQSDPCRALRGCSLLISPLKRVSWGRSNPIKPQLYLQIIP